MSVDAPEHDRSIADDGIEISGRWKLLVRPQLLVPAGAENPLGVRMRRRIVAQSLLQIRERRRADEIDRTEPLTDDPGRAGERPREAVLTAGVQLVAQRRAAAERGGDDVGRRRPSPAASCDCPST